jgi:hypothetical protein
MLCFDEVEYQKLGDMSDIQFFKNIAIICQNGLLIVAL